MSLFFRSTNRQGRIYARAERRDITDQESMTSQGCCLGGCFPSIVRDGDCFAGIIGRLGNTCCFALRLGIVLGRRFMKFFFLISRSKALIVCIVAVFVQVV